MFVLENVREEVLFIAIRAILTAISVSMCLGLYLAGLTPLWHTAVTGRGNKHFSAHLGVQVLAAVCLAVNVAMRFAVWRVRKNGTMAREDHVNVGRAVSAVLAAGAAIAYVPLLADDSAASLSAVAKAVVLISGNIVPLAVINSQKHVVKFVKLFITRRAIPCTSKSNVIAPAV